ncbi:hypothetical protein DdX_08540 [Ditylenchus destructor]|uniref:Uncharacterized protein n=1 Tax=Ditylenchus destructor TaxID=166010 RepID=A0AAD4N7W1_9BILA|nr:hypothetical protein DdX_08540 [Ditylenchus destructor]
MLKQNVAHENKENVAVPETAPFDSSVRGSASGHGRGSHTGGYQSEYGQKTQDPLNRQEGHDFGDTTSTVQSFGNYTRGNTLRGTSRGGMTRGVNNQNSYGQKAEDSPSHQEHGFGAPTMPQYGNYSRGNTVRLSSRGMTRDFNSEIPKETPAIQNSVFTQDMNQNIVTRGGRFGRGRGGSFEGFSGHNEPPAVSETAKVAPVMEPPSPQNVVPRGGISNARGSRGGRGGIHYGEDVSERAEPPVVSETAKEAPVMQPPSPQNVVPRGGISNARGSRGGRGGIHYGEDVSERVEPPVVSETVKEAPAPQTTIPVQDVSQNGVARVGFGTSRGGTVRGGLNRGEDLSGYTPTADAGYGHPLILPQSQSGEKLDGTSDKAHPWHTRTSCAQTPVAQPPATENGGLEVKGILKKTVPQTVAKDDGDDVRISKEDFAKFALMLNDMATSFNNLNAFVQQLVKKF